jgi:hypothetical protein
MAAERSKAEVISAAIDAKLLDLHTSMPGRVHKYDGDNNTVDVEPVVKRAVPRDDGTYAVEALPIIHNVPIAWPRGGGYAIRFPLSKGNAVTLHFSEVATAIWRTTGQISEPGDVVRHDLSYACAYPGGASPDKEKLASPGNAMVIDIVDLLRLGGNDAKFVALAELVDDNFQRIKDLFTNWTPVAMDGGAALKTASGSLNFDSTAASKVKAE